MKATDVECCQPVNVEVTIEISSIGDIKEINQSFEVKFSLTLKWKDDRLNYYNLNEENLANMIDDEQRQEIWIPSLVFNNTPNNVMVANRRKGALLYVQKSEAKKAAPLTDIDENYFYSGAENFLIFNIDYSLVHHLIKI